MRGHYGPVATDITARTGTERPPPLPGRALRRVGTRWSTGTTRVRRTAWTVAQCAVGAGVSWEIATRVLGHDRPFFSAIAAVVCLGTSHAQRVRRVGELGVGVALGVVIGGLVIQEIGSGGWQLALVVGGGMALAQLLDGGVLLTNQVALQAVLVAVLPPPTGGNVTRWVDAVTGGLVALVVAALAPPDPRREAKLRASALVTELAEVVGLGARAIRHRDADLASQALHRARATQSDVDGWDAALVAGMEISRISPLRRRRRADLERCRVGLVGVDRATRNMRVALRHIEAVLDRDGSLPSRVATALDDFSAALTRLAEETTEGLRRRLPARVRRARGGAAGREPRGDTRPGSADLLRDLAPRLDPERLGADSLSATVITAQLRSAVVDLLVVHGMDVEEARDLLPR